MRAENASVGLRVSTSTTSAMSVARRSAPSSGRVNTAKNRRSTRAARKASDHRRPPLAPVASHPAPAARHRRLLGVGADGVASGAAGGVGGAAWLKKNEAARTAGLLPTLRLVLGGLVASPQYFTFPAGHSKNVQPGCQ
jgi:hypothetical protein